MRRIYFLILLITCLNPAGWAQNENPFTVTGDAVTWNNYTLTITGDVTVKNTDYDTPITKGHIVITGGSEDDPIEVTLDGINMDVSSSFGSALDVTKNSHVKIILKGINVAISRNSYSGLHVPESATVEITADSDEGNKLIARCKDDSGAAGAGIGGIPDENSGLIIISGGTIIASCEYTGAGIGGGEMGYGNVLISGGNITATSGNGAAIGNGIGGKGGTITISGGIVKATASMCAAGIGGGGYYHQNSSCGNITITGGIIEAQGGEIATGIGSGACYYSSSTSEGQITITAGEITSKGGKGSPSDIGGAAYFGNNSYVKDLIIGPDVELKNNPTIQPDNYNGFVFKDGSATVCGEIELPIDIKLDEGETLIIPENAKLVIPENKSITFNEGATLTVENGAELANSGALKIDGAIKGGGTITGEGTVSNKDNETVYTVSFDLNGKTGDFPGQLIKSGEKAVGQTPVRDYYAFAGWYDTDAATGGIGIADKTITENTMFYARWKANEFTATPSADQQGIYGTKLTYDLTDLVTTDTDKPCGPITYSLKTGNTHPLNLSLASNGQVTGTPDAATETQVTYIATAANNVSHEIIVTYKIDKRTLYITPHAGQILYQDEDDLIYSVSGIVNDDSPLNDGELGKDNNLITQGTLDLNEEGKTKYTLSFLSNVEYATSSDKVTEAEATVPPANTESWHKEDIVLTAPQGFTIAETSVSTSSLMQKNGGVTVLTWTKEGLNQTVSYTLTRTTTGNTYDHTAMVSLDKTPPVLTVAPNGLSYTLNASDMLSRLQEVTVDGASISLSGSSYSGNGIKGQHTATATDKAGNTISISFGLVDQTPPVDPTVYYTITLPAVEGATTDPAAGEYEVESWSSFRFYLTLDSDYSQSEPVVTTDRGETLAPRTSDGAYIVTMVHSDVEISIDGIVKNPDPVANEELQTEGIRIYAGGGYLHIQTPKPEKVYIFTPDGRLKTMLPVTDSGERIALPKGVYFVKAGERVYKTVL